MNNYQFLIARLDAFIRKYYANKLLKGAILFLSCVIAFYLIISVGEYFFYFPSWLRYTLLTLSVLLASVALIGLIIWPLIQMSKIGKSITHEQAAKIIGTHFTNVEDKLLNVLQLKQKVHETTNKALIEASIEQKTAQLSPIPFQSAIEYTKNKKYLKYLVPPVLIGLFILFAAPNLFKESATRLFSPDKIFTPPAPFTFKLLTQKLTVPQYEDLTIEATTEGKTIPEKLFVETNGQQIQMLQKEKNKFSYTFYKVAKNTSFQFTSGGYSSNPYTINILYKPIVKEFKVSVNYPSYTGRKNEVLDNIGDLVVPQGTVLSWNIKTEHTDNIDFILGASRAGSMIKNGDHFSTSYKFMRDTNYGIVVSNKDIAKADSINYHIAVIPDQYPSINVQQYNDSLTGNYVLFTGEAGDDYGLRSVALQFDIQKTDGNGNTKGSSKHGMMPVTISPGTFTTFNQFIDIEELKLEPGDKLTYYFSACDNDAVNGSKCTNSQTFTYEQPSEKKLDSIIEKAQAEINKDLNNTTKQTEKVDKQIKDLQQKILDKKELEWQDKKQLEELMQRNENVQSQIDKIKEKFENNIKQSEQKEHSDELREKQEDVRKLMEELQNNEMKERMKKMEELMKLLNKDQLFDQLKKMKEENALVEKDLDRMVEMMKQLERDTRMEDVAKKAEDLAKKEDELNKANDNNTKSDATLKKEQEQLKKELDDLKKDMQELDKVNEETENKEDLSEAKKEMQNAEEQMKESADQLGGKSGDSKSGKSKASKAQKSAKNSLEKMGEKLSEGAAGDTPDELEIDIKATRQILQNLIRMSFSQEDLINDVQKTSTTAPKYVSNIQLQQKLKNDTKQIADSLFSLSKRIFKLSSFVNKEVDVINRNMESAIDNLEARNIPGASINQNYVMTGGNNLALMLNELLQQLQQQQAESQAQQNKPGNGSCKKPGSGKGKGQGKGKGKGKGQGQGVGMQLGDIMSKQQKLGDAMKQLMDKMGKSGKDGKDGKDGKGKDGKGGKEGQSGSNGGGSGGQGAGSEGENQQSESEQMARIAAQQSALRKQLTDINNQLKKEGKSNPEIQKIQQDMDRNETDIVNKRLTQELLNRQSSILSRLLETKEAMREQDQGEERESKSGKEQTKEIPAQLKDILKNKQSIIDYYKTVPPDLKPYYKKMVEDYFNMIK